MSARRLGLLMLNASWKFQCVICDVQGIARQKLQLSATYSTTRFNSLVQGFFHDVMISICFILLSGSVANLICHMQFCTCFHIDVSQNQQRGNPMMMHVSTLPYRQFCQISAMPKPQKVPRGTQETHCTYAVIALHWLPP